MSRLIIILLVVLPLRMAAQNLLPNPGFEKRSSCPDSPGQISLASYWFTPTKGTPDYFNSCSPGLDYGTEFNKRGGQRPHSGTAYAGLQFYFLNRNEYYEYIESPLDSALRAGTTYCIKAYVSLGESSYAFNRLTAIFSENELKLSTHNILKIKGIELTNGRYLIESNGWMCIRGTYTARGGEQFLTIGAVNPKTDFWHILQRTRTDSLFQSTYYFIDDISVEAIADSSACNCNREK